MTKTNQMLILMTMTINMFWLFNMLTPHQEVNTCTFEMAMALTVHTEKNWFMRVF